MPFSSAYCSRRKIKNSISLDIFIPPDIEGVSRITRDLLAFPKIEDSLRGKLQHCKFGIKKHPVRFRMRVGVQCVHRSDTVLLDNATDHCGTVVTVDMRFDAHYTFTASQNRSKSIAFWVLNAY